MENLNLQLFADEEVEVVEDTSDEAQEEHQEESHEESKPEIPEELEGLDLSKDEITEILKEVPEPPAEADSDNKQVEAKDDTPQRSIPYARFKEVLDKQHTQEEEIASLKRQLEAAKQPAQPTPQPMQQPTQPTPQPTSQPSFSPEIAKQLDDAVIKQAMQMTGMTKDDIDALEYADDDDPKATQFRYAKDLARANIIGNIQETARRQREYSARILADHQKLVNDFNEFYQKEVAEPDYNETVQFATNEFFESQNPGVQYAVAGAYSRVQRNTASPQDILVVKNFYREAKNAFHAKNASPQQPKQNKPTMPRSQEVSGSATSPKESVSVASLQKMLEENRVEDIPEKYQKILLGL